MRNGFLFKPFTLKQINTVNIRPTQAERNEFLEIFNKYQDADKSEIETETLKRAIKQNSSNEIAKGEKIYVVSGELVSIFGTVVDFEKDG